MITDLWGSIRSFAASGDEPAHARWRELKNLSHLVSNHPQPAPFWEYLKTVLVQEMGAPESAFKLVNLQLRLDSVVGGPGIRWGPASFETPTKAGQETAWLLQGDSGDGGGAPSLPPFGWDKPGYLADQGLLRGIPWGAVAVVVSPRAGTRCHIPLASGFLSARAYNEADEKLTRAWREALLFEEEAVRRASETLPILERVRAWAAEEEGLTWTGMSNWAKRVATLSPERPLPPDNQGHRSLGLDRERSFQNLARAYVSERQLGWTPRQGASPPSLEAAIASEFPGAGPWGGGARSVLGQHALNSFVEADRRGREGLWPAFLKVEKLNQYQRGQTPADSGRQSMRAAQEYFGFPARRR